PKNERAYNALGYALDSQNKRGEAIAVLRQGLKHLPEEVQLHLGLARILWNQRRLAEAADGYRQAIRLNPPGNVYWSHHLGWVLNAQEKPKEAVDALRKAIDINPKFAAAHYELGLSFAALGQTADAVASFRTAIEFDPKVAGAYFRLANALRT